MTRMASTALIRRSSLSIFRDNRTTVRSRRVVNPLFIDTSTRITAKPEQGSVRADRRSKTDILITLTDARANPVTDREVQIELFTTSEYTGLVGAGSFDHERVGALDLVWQPVTDIMGQVKVTYLTGRNEKTIQAYKKDLKDFQNFLQASTIDLVW
jgi:hypothetical protein